MSVFKVNVVVIHPADLGKRAPPLAELVDTDSELTWLSSDVLASIGIVPLRKRSFRTATNQMIQRDVGYAILQAEGFETIDEVVFAEAGDLSLLGVRTLEGFGVVVDNLAHRLVATTTLVAGSFSP
jgi:predicted aspartyl protease